MVLLKVSGVFWSFCRFYGISVIFRFKGIFVILELSGVFWSFWMFRRNFCQIRGFRGILVIFEALGSMSVIFRGIFVILKFLGILVILEGVKGILAIFKVLDVFLLYIFIDYWVIGWIGFYILKTYFIYFTIPFYNSLNISISIFIYNSLK